jgi:hypothetical protein
MLTKEIINKVFFKLVKDLEGKELGKELYKDGVDRFLSDIRQEVSMRSEEDLQDYCKILIQFSDELKKFSKKN